MKKLWSAAELSSVLGKTARGIRKRARSEKWDYIAIPSKKGPRSNAYIYDTLPQEVQSAILLAHPEAPAPREDNAGKVEEIRSGALQTFFETKTQKSKDEARRRFAAVDAVYKLVEGGSGKTEAKELVARQKGVSAATLYRWMRMVEGYDRSDWLFALTPGYFGRTKTVEIPPDAWEEFKAEYLTQEQRTAASCYQRLTNKAPKRGWKLPACKTFERRIKNEIPRSVFIFLRKGEKALMRLYPPMDRDKTKLHAVEWINGDGYKHNVFVKWPGVENPVRPKTWFWQDVHSNKILGYRIDLSENTDTIRLAFLEVVEKYGIPKHITIDNTRAAANKWMTGGVANRFRFKVKAEDPLGLFPLLGCKVHWATPGWGQSKPIERQFGVGGIGEYVDKHPLLAGAWTGNNTGNKPENYGSRIVDLETFQKAVVDGVATINAIEKRRTKVCGGVYSFDQAFARSYDKTAPKVITQSQRRMLLLMAEAVRVSKDGTIKLEAGKGYGVGHNRYFHEKLNGWDYAGKKIIIRFDPQRLHDPVHCYSLGGKYICEASCVHAAGFGDTEAARDHNRARNTFKKAVKQAAKAETRMSAIESAEKLPDLPLDNPLESKVVELDFSQTVRKSRQAVGQDFKEEEEIDTDALFSKGVALLKQQKEMEE